MSAAVTRANNELTQPAETGVPGNLDAPPVIEGTRVTGTDRGISDHGMTPLMRAACDGLSGTVQALLDRGAEVNAKRSDGFNALALAVFFGHSQVVWLLLENGADLAVTGRSETLPETWADARGFFDIGTTLREARAREQEEAASLSTAEIDESAHFSRQVENEKLQRVGDPGTGVETAAIAEATDFETTLAMKPAFVAEESTATKSESTGDIVRSDKSDHSQQQTVIKQSVRAVKTLPEIEDPPALAVPRFHPGSAFVARITSSRKTLVALILALLLVCSGIAAFLFPQIRKSLGRRQTEVVGNVANLPAEPSNTVAGSETNVSGTVATPSAATTEPTAPASSDIEKNPADTAADSKPVESTSQVEPAAVSEDGSAGVAAARGSQSRAHLWSDDRVADASEDKRDSAATSVSRSGTRTRKQRAVSRAVKLTQQTVTEEQPKPAPLNVETSRSHSVPSTRAESANEVLSNQPPSLNIISGKPKSKVIQWP